MTFDPDLYTITIRKETDDGETCYVGTVAEFRNVSVYEDTHEAALAAIRDVLTTIAKMAEETGQPLPAPQAESGESPSGRITLRMPRSLHAKVIRRAEQDDTSANQVINIAVAEYLSTIDTAQRAVEIIRSAAMKPATTIVLQKEITSFSVEEEAWHGKPNVHVRAPSRTSLRSFGYQREWKPS